MNRGRNRWFGLAVAAAAGLLLSACEDLVEDQFTTLYNSPTFQACGGCHAPDAPGFAPGVEETQDWSTRDNAFDSLRGTASGLVGNFAGCNDVPLIGDTPETSLLVATLDEDVRSNFSLTDYPDCNADAISDMTLKVAAFSTSDLDLLKQWISDGAPDI